jgi:folylpolyglutamate synthase/dihydropteroate synthase
MGWQEIASHKAGILKKGVPGFTVPQRPDAMEVLTVGIPLK